MFKRSLVTMVLFPMARYQTIFLILFGIPSVQSSLTRAVDFKLSQSLRISFSHTFAILSSLAIYYWNFLSIASCFSFSLCAYYCLFSATSLLIFCCSSSVFWGRLSGRKLIGSSPSVLPLLTAMNLKRSRHSEENTLPIVLGTEPKFELPNID